MNESLKLTFWGGAGAVTGANFILESAEFKVMVDCGLYQGSKLCEEGVCVDENKDRFPYDPRAVNVLLVTHAHIDHIGRIPKLVREGFGGVIYSTPETRKLAEIMLLDSASVIAKEARKGGEDPLYEEKDVWNAMALWEDIPYHTKRTIGGGFTAYLKDAGHIMGSSIIELSYHGTKVVFTGDLGNSPSLLLEDTEVVSDADYMIMESVYGDRNHEPKVERSERFRKIVKEAVLRGGALVIPAFSLERTQVILYELNALAERGELANVPVFLDSPLAIKVTQIYKAHANHFNEKVRTMIAGGDDVFKFPRLRFTTTTEESKAILGEPNPKIIIAGSGMSNGGRVLHHERHYLSDPKSTLLLIGYEAVGTLGRLIQDGAKNVTIMGDQIQVRAKIESIRGYSSHKDSDNLVEFVANTKDTLKKVFVAMGEPKSSLFLIQRLRDYVGVNAVYPRIGEAYELKVFRSRGEKERTAITKSEEAVIASQ